MKQKILALLLLLTLTLTACNNLGGGSGTTPPPDGNDNVVEEIKDDGSSHGESLEKLGALDGYFEGSANDISINCVSGTQGCYKVEGNVITFTALKTDSVYSISGKFSGSIVIDIGDAHRFELELCGFSMVSNNKNPITVLSGDEVTIQAKKDTKNYIYDYRAEISASDTESLSGAIHSDVDMEISGKGDLFVVSRNNNGIHSKKDLQVKNLSLTVGCKDNALKGNDSVAFENARAYLIASMGDGVKTSRTDISDKGNQRGTISFDGGYYNVYSAGDGVDAAYNVVVNAGTTLSIFTAKYSNLSEIEFTEDRSSKGIKAGNEIVINSGDLRIKAIDNAIHVSNDTVLENNASPLGNLTVKGGKISLLSQGEGLRAAGNLVISGGSINIVYSYQGLKADSIAIKGGTVGIFASSDGINAQSLSFDGGKTLIVSTGGYGAAINSKSRYTYNAGSVVAIMREGTTAVTYAKNCKDFGAFGTQKELDIVSGNCLVCTVGSDTLTVNMRDTLSAAIIMLGSNGASAQVASENSKGLSLGDFIWE